MRSVLSVSLPENLSSELEAFAKKTGRNKSDIVKESVSLYLWEARFRNVRKALALSQGKEGRPSYRRRFPGCFMKVVFRHECVGVTF